MSSVIVECKKLCLFRCLSALALCICMQFFLLGVFLLLVNFNLLHPLLWISDTVSLLFSFYTWLSVMPSISVIIIYGVLLGKCYLAVKPYYRTRFTFFARTSARKLAFLASSAILGFLTALLYARFLHENYRSPTYICYESNCLNSYYIFLVGAGISAGCYHFCKQNFGNDPEIEFPLLQEKKLVKIRSLLHSILYNSLLQSIAPTFCYAFGFCIFGGFVTTRLSRLFGMELESSISIFAIATNLRLLFYAWILSSQILSNINFMEQFFSIFLAEEIEFEITKNTADTSDKSVLTLADCLGICQVPVVQSLAALNLYKIGSSPQGSKRQEIFSLSVPGGHPYNWNQISGQCLALINEFTDELATSVKNISTVRSSPVVFSIDKGTAKEAAEKILLRQYNATYGIRRMVSECPTLNIESSVSSTVLPTAVDVVNFGQRINAQFDYLSQKFEETINRIFVSFPGLFYVFGEYDGAKTAFLLSNSQMIVWVIQGLANICAASLHEDKYGVVQVSLPQVIRVLLKLQAELNKLNNVNLNGKKFDRNFTVLKKAVKRSLYIITTKFGDYLLDLFEDPEEIRILRTLAAYLDI